MGQFVTEKGVFPPLTRWPPYRHSERSWNARKHVRGISHTCRYPYWFRGCVAADLFHWLFLSSVFRGVLLSRGLKIKRNDNGLIFRELALHTNYQGSLNAVVLDYHRLFCGSVIFGKTRRTNTRGDTLLNRFESWKLGAMKSTRDRREEQKSEYHV